MNRTDATKDLFSIGCLCGQLQHGVRDIEAAAAGLGISPAMRINGVPHYDGDQVAQIAAAFRGDQGADRIAKEKSQC